MNPIILIPQIITVYTSPQAAIEAISPFTWTCFLLIQIGLMMNAVKTRAFWVFVSMFFSALGSLSVVLGVFIRG